MVRTGGRRLAQDLFLSCASEDMCLANDLDTGARDDPDIEPTGTSLQLLESGKSASLSLNTFGYSGFPTLALHSGSFAVLGSSVRHGFDAQLDSDPGSHSKDNGWLQGEKGIYFGNLNKSYSYSNNPDWWI